MSYELNDLSSRNRSESKYSNDERRMQHYSPVSSIPTHDGERSVVLGQDIGRQNQNFIKPDSDFETMTAMFPALDSKVIRTILDGNKGDLGSSIEAALALNVSLSHEKGIAVVNNKLSSPQGNFDSQTNIVKPPISNGNYTDPSIAKTAKYDPSSTRTGTVLQPCYRGCSVSLPALFLKPPRFRVIVNSINDAYTYFTVIFRRKDDKLGITVQEIAHEIKVKAVHAPKGSQQSLAVQAGVLTDDVLIGLNNEYFCQGIPVPDVVQALSEASDPVTVHFLRRHHMDDNNSNNNNHHTGNIHGNGHGNGNAPQQAPLHKCASILLEQGLISIDRARNVSAAILRLKQRTLQWESGWISQQVDHHHQSASASPSSSRSRHSLSHSESMGGTRQTSHKSFSSSSSSSPRMSSNRKSTSHMDVASASASAVADSGNIYGDMVVQTRSLRPALAIRILRCEYVHDHTCFVIWVLDVKTGAEWVVRRRFREFYDFRETISGIRTGISNIPFPGRSLSLPSDAISSTALAESRLKVLEQFLRRIANLVCVHSLHPATSRVQLALQQFLDVEERLESLALLRLSYNVALRQTVQVFVHSVLNLGPLDELVSTSASSRSLIRMEKTVDGLREFIDNLQGVLIEGLGDDCLGIAQSYKSTATGSDDDQIQDGEGHSFKFERCNGPGSGYDALGSSKGNNNNNNNTTITSVMIENAESKQGKKIERLKKIVRAAIRRQVEILVFVPCSGCLRHTLTQTLEGEERRLQSKLQILHSRPQTFFGISGRLESPSEWREAVCTMQMLPRKSLPQDRLECLLAVAAEIPRLFQMEHPSDERPLGADEFLPVFIFVLVRARIAGLLSLKEQLLTFCDPELRISEMGYYTATLEASVQHIIEMDENRFHMDCCFDAERTRSSEIDDEDDEFGLNPSASMTAGGGGGGGGDGIAPSDNYNDEDGNENHSHSSGGASGSKVGKVEVETALSSNNRNVNSDIDENAIIS
eukprot:gene784-1511_t